MATIAVPLSPDVREALVARLAPTLGSRHARREVARAAPGQPVPLVEQAVADLRAALRAADAEGRAVRAADRPQRNTCTSPARTAPGGTATRPPPTVTRTA